MYYYYSYYYEWQTKKELQKKIREHVEKNILPKIRKILSDDICPYWSNYDQFGIVFADSTIKETDSRKIIGKGKKYLFQEIKNNYYCIVLSELPEFNSDEFCIDGKPCLRININKFKEFYNIITDKNRIPKLFLYKFKNDKHSEIIKDWIKNSGEITQVIEPILDPKKLEEFLKTQVRSDEDLQRIMDLAKVSHTALESQIEWYGKQLKEYKRKITNPVFEEEIHQFIYDNIWILNFKYLDYEKRKKYPVPNGEIDIFLRKKRFGISEIAVVEFKRPDTRLTITSDRVDKTALYHTVGRAYTQVINYIESLPRDNFTIVEGIVVAGRRMAEADEFIKIFNKYSHGVKIVTFDDLGEDVERILNALNPSKTPQS